MDRKQRLIIDELEDLLDRERTMLRSGAVQELSRLADQKVRLMKGLSAAAEQSSLTRLREKAARNARMLDAAGKGIRSVANRISALRAGPQQMERVRLSAPKAAKLSGAPNPSGCGQLKSAVSLGQSSGGVRKLPAWSHSHPVRGGVARAKNQPLTSEWRICIAPAMFFQKPLAQSRH